MMRRTLPRRHLRAPLAAASVLFLSLPASGPAATGLASPNGQAPAAAPSPGTLAIDHSAPGCFAAGKYARVAACFRPPAALARARLYFRAGGTRDWFYVEMSGTPPCLEGVLPRPKKGLQQVEYYLAATDRAFAESRTPERVVQVTNDGRCPAGPVAPLASSASGVIGSASGAAPVGFVTGGGLSPLLIVGGLAVVGGGAAAIVVAGGGGGETPPTTTLPPETTTTTTTTATTTTTTTTTLPPLPPPTTTTTTTTTLPPPTTTTTTTTTTTLPPCETPNQPPIVDIASPRTGDVLGGNSATVNASASDPAPGSGVKEVRFYYQYCPGACGAPNFIGSAATSPYSVVWTFPSCPPPPVSDYYQIRARAEDGCGNVSLDSVVGVRLTKCPTFRGDARSRPAGSWVSELSVPEARGQVVVDGTEAVFPAGGMETFSVSTGPGTHRFEATLVDGAGRPGTWRFDLSTLGVVPGSVRVVAGEAALAGSAAVAFRLRGKPGERVVFTFEVGGEK